MLYTALRTNVASSAARLRPLASSVTVTLRGTINLVTGRLVLNGRTADGDIVHVSGGIADGGSGGISIGGDVMFNPQPEPPGHVF